MSHEIIEHIKVRHGYYSFDFSDVYSFSFTSVDPVDIVYEVGGANPNKTVILGNTTGLVYIRTSSDRYNASNTMVRSSVDGTMLDVTITYTKRTLIDENEIDEKLIGVNKAVRVLHDSSVDYYKDLPTTGLSQGDIVKVRFWGISNLTKKFGLYELTSTSPYTWRYVPEGLSRFNSDSYESTFPYVYTPDDLALLGNSQSSSFGLPSDYVLHGGMTYILTGDVNIGNNRITFKGDGVVTIIGSGKTISATVGGFMLYYGDGGGATNSCFGVHMTGVALYNSVGDGIGGTQNSFGHFNYKLRNCRVYAKNVSFLAYGNQITVDAIGCQFLTWGTAVGRPNNFVAANGDYSYISFVNTTFWTDSDSSPAVVGNSVTSSFSTCSFNGCTFEKNRNDSIGTYVGLRFYGNPDNMMDFDCVPQIVSCTFVNTNISCIDSVNSSSWRNFVFKGLQYVNGSDLTYNTYRETALPSTKPVTKSASNTNWT